AGPFVIVDRHRTTALSSPFLQGLAVVDQAYSGPFDALDVQNALGRLAPGAWHIANDHHAQSTALYRLFHAYVLERHSRLQQRPFCAKYSIDAGGATSRRTRSLLQM